MEKHPIQIAATSGLNKSSMLDQEMCQYMLRSVLAGLYLGIIVFLYWSLLQNLSGSPFGKVVASLFFGVGLFIIVITGAELFTSNNMYMTISSLAGRTSWKQTMFLWIVCYIGNLAGSFFIALLLLGAGSYASLPPDHALYVGALSKVNLPAEIIFFRGILANWIVCLAIWTSLHFKEDVAKFLAIIFIISIFLYLGFEHSIANMGTFSMAILGKGEVTVLEAAYNLFWATAGNIIGGGAIIGLIYWVINRKQYAIGKDF
ncbi:MAG: formate/nitrite transporter family protein [Alphaproteobacteria bacterium]|nr:formate/nitrite transporter family protein [Alphaproteobacteria bacterium]